MRFLEAGLRTSPGQSEGGPRTRIQDQNQDQNQDQIQDQIQNQSINQI